MHIRVLHSSHVDLDIVSENHASRDLGDEEYMRRDCHRRRVTMTSKIIKYVLWAGMLISALSVSRFGASLAAQQSTTSAVDALQKARVLGRLAEATPAEHKGTAPGFVLDPAWPQPLPHHWVIGHVGGIAIDKHEHIWVYHRPRSISSTDSGMQGVAGTDAKGKPISALGVARPYGHR
jgi:hypothetical protein